MHGRAGADWLIGFRLVQGVGAAFLIANSAAILTDAFPANQRGLALGLNNVVGISGQFIGLLVGGLLAPINWRLVFLVSVPFGLFGTVWSHRKLREIGVRNPAPIDWLGNADLRGRARADHDRHHLRDPAVRRPHDGLDEPVRARLPRRRRRAARRVRGRRVARRAPDVQAAAVPHPRLHLRRAVELPLRGRARRADVHADHLAAGHLAAAARVQLQPARRCGRASTCCR